MEENKSCLSFVIVIKCMRCLQYSTEDSAVRSRLHTKGVRILFTVILDVNAGDKVIRFKGWKKNQPYAYMDDVTLCIVLKVMKVSCYTFSISHETNLFPLRAFALCTFSCISCKWSLIMEWIYLGHKIFLFFAVDFFSFFFCKCGKMRNVFD